jgi:hypothetical protein
MRTIANLLRAVQRQDLRNESLQAMADTKDKYLQHQKDQLFAGFDSTGKRLKPYAQPWYATKKASMNPLPGYGNPDFYLTGAFYRSFRADIDNEGLVVYATDEKAPDLEARDPNIFTLFEDALGAYINDVKPAFKERITKTLNYAAL